MWGLSYVLDFPRWLRTALRVWSLIVGLVVLVTAVIDLRRGPRRDWLHWLGVAIIAVAVLVDAEPWLWSMFAMHLVA